MIVHFVYIVTYLEKMLVDEWLLNYLCILKKNVTDSINNKVIIQLF